MHSRLQVFVCSGYDLCHRMVDPKFEFLILTPVTVKSKTKPEVSLSAGAFASNVYLRYFRNNTHIKIFYDDDLKPRKYARVTSILLYNQGSSVGLRMQDYKSMCPAVTICDTLVNIQTDTQTHRHTQTTFRPAYINS